MENYTVVETFTLPSKGAIYNVKVNPNIQLTSMTTAHEMKRLSPSDLPYKNLCDIIDDCMVDDPGISSYDMCLGDYLFLLHRLRTVTYGSTYRLITECPYCGFQQENKINLDELKLIEYTQDTAKLYEQYSKVVLPKSNIELELTFQTPRIFDKIEMDKKELQKRTGEYVPDIAFTIANAVVGINGRRPNPIMMMDWVKGLPMVESNMILNYVNRLNGLVGVDLIFDVHCDMCKMDYKAAFKSTSEFFRPALD